MTRAARGVASALVALAVCAALGAARSDTPGLSCAVLKDDAVWLPGGTIRIGDEAGYPEEQPPYEVTVKGFWIDRHEVTNAQFARFVAATRYVTLAERRGDGVVFRPPAATETPTEPRDWWKIVAGADWRHPEGPDSTIAGRGRWPVVQIAYADALAYAQWAGRALPDEEQFEYAAAAGVVGNRSQPAPNRANTWQGVFPTINTAEDGRKGLAPVGCYAPDSGGVHDMIGNAWEWTRSWYLPSHGNLVMGEGAPTNPSFDPHQPEARVRVIKGGSFLCAPNYCARYRPSARHAQDELQGASHLGFRTVKPLNPGV